jgi:hypothetical protein
MLKKNIPSTHKFSSGLRMLNSLRIDKSIKNELFVGNNILEGYTKFSSFKESSALLPLNGLTIIIQMSRSKT